MTDIEWLHSELARFTYKPGWRFVLDASGHAFTLGGEMSPFNVVRVSYPAKDSRRPDEVETTIKVKISVPPYIEDEDAFARWLIEAISEIERHEAQEWLRRDGVMLFDPHADRGGIEER